MSILEEIVGADFITYRREDWGKFYGIPLASYQNRTFKFFLQVQNADLTRVSLSGDAYL